MSRLPRPVLFQRPLSVYPFIEALVPEINPAVNQTNHQSMLTAELDRIEQSLNQQAESVREWQKNLILKNDPKLSNHLINQSINQSISADDPIGEPDIDVDDDDEYVEEEEESNEDSNDDSDDRPIDPRLDPAIEEAFIRVNNNPSNSRLINRSEYLDDGPMQIWDDPDEDRSADYVAGQSNNQSNNQSNEQSNFPSDEEYDDPSSIYQSIDQSINQSEELFGDYIDDDDDPVAAVERFEAMERERLAQLGQG